MDCQRHGVLLTLGSIIRCFYETNAPGGIKSMTLAGLAAAVLLIFRRRKQSWLTSTLILGRALPPGDMSARLQGFLGFAEMNQVKHTVPEENGKLSSGHHLPVLKRLRERASKSYGEVLIYAALALSVAAVTIAVVIGGSDREPYYQGKPFSYWLDRLPVTYVGSGGGRAQPILVYSSAYKTPAEVQQAYENLQHQQELAVKAVTLIGGRCLPLLIRRLQSQDSALKTTAGHWAIKLHLIDPSWFRTADMKRGQALTAIVNQGYTAKPIFRDLAALTHHNDPAIRAAAKYALQYLRPEEFERLEKLQKVNK
jgi:hypothetical protein